MRWPPTFWTTLGYRSVKRVAAIQNKTMIVIPTTNSQTPSAESTLTLRVMWLMLTPKPVITTKAMCVARKTTK